MLHRWWEYMAFFGIKWVCMGIKKAPDLDALGCEFNYSISHLKHREQH